jgi:DNA primase
VALSPQFLDELRDRTTLSALISGAVKLEKAGREFKGCCPFHQEKTPSFTVNDEKGFYHCFGCGAHGDAIRWLTDARGLPFIDAVKELAAAAGMEVPAPSPEAQARAARVEGVRPALEAAQALFSRELRLPERRANISPRAGSTMRRSRGSGLAGRRRGAAMCGSSAWISRRARCGARLAAARIGGARLPGAHHLPGARRSRPPDRVQRPIAPTLRERPQIQEQPRQPRSSTRERPCSTFTAPAPAARTAKRLIVVEGQMDVIALDQVGIAEVVAPMGTALTTGAADALGGQLERLWRLADRPILAFDGDAAGRPRGGAGLRGRAAACRTRALASVALFPPGKDPDDVARAFDPAIAGTRAGAGARAVEAVLCEAVPIGRLLFDAVAAERAEDDPESVAGVWERLDALARTIRDEETRAQYLAAWRSGSSGKSACPRSRPPLPALHAQIEAAEGGYAWPEEQDESERRLIAIVQRGLELRRQRARSESLKDLLAVAKAIGFSTKAINAAFRDIEAEADEREDHEAMWALYRRVLGSGGR